MRLTVYGLFVSGLTHFSATIVAISLNIVSSCDCLSLSDTWSSPLARIFSRGKEIKRSKYQKKVKMNALRHWKKRWPGKDFLLVCRFLLYHLSQKLCSNHPSSPPGLWTRLRKRNVFVKPHPGLSLWKKNTMLWLFEKYTQIRKWREYHKLAHECHDTMFPSRTFYDKEFHFTCSGDLNVLNNR